VAVFLEVKETLNEPQSSLVCQEEITDMVQKSTDIHVALEDHNEDEKVLDGAKSPIAQEIKSLQSELAEIEGSIRASISPSPRNITEDKVGGAERSEEIEDLTPTQTKESQSISNMSVRMAKDRALRLSEVFRILQTSPQVPSIDVAEMLQVGIELSGGTPAQMAALSELEAIPPAESQVLFEEFLEFLTPTMGSCSDESFVRGVQKMCAAAENVRLKRGDRKSTGTSGRCKASSLSTSPSKRLGAKDRSKSRSRSPRNSPRELETIIDDEPLEPSKVQVDMTSVPQNETELEEYGRQPTSDEAVEIVSPELAKKFSDMKAYYSQGVDVSNASALPLGVTDVASIGLQDVEREYVEEKSLFDRYVHKGWISETAILDIARLVEGEHYAMAVRAMSTVMGTADLNRLVGSTPRLGSPFTPREMEASKSKSMSPKVNEIEESNKRSTSSMEEEAKARAKNMTTEERKARLESIRTGVPTISSPVIINTSESRVPKLDFASLLDGTDLPPMETALSPPPAKQNKAEIRTPNLIPKLDFGKLRSEGEGPVSAMPVASPDSDDLSDLGTLSDDEVEDKEEQKEAAFRGDERFVAVERKYAELDRSAVMPGGEAEEGHIPSLSIVTSPTGVPSLNIVISPPPKPDTSDRSLQRVDSPTGGQHLAYVNPNQLPLQLLTPRGMAHRGLLPGAHVTIALGGPSIRISWRKTEHARNQSRSPGRSPSGDRGLKSLSPTPSTPRGSAKGWNVRIGTPRQHSTRGEVNLSALENPYSPRGGVDEHTCRCYNNLFLICMVGFTEEELDIDFNSERIDAKPILSSPSEFARRCHLLV